MRASLMRWHRRVGLAAALLVLLATVTGLLINHADGLGLAREPVQARWLLRWWGVQSPELQFACSHPPTGGGDAHWLSLWSGRLMLDAQGLKTPPLEGVVGCLATDEAWLVADRQQLLVLQADGALVDQLPYPAGFVAERMGRNAQAVLVVEGVAREAVGATDATASGQPNAGEGGGSDATSGGAKSSGATSSGAPAASGPVASKEAAAPTDHPGPSAPTAPTAGRGATASRSGAQGHRGTRLQADAALSSWQPAAHPAEDLTWAHGQPLPDALRARIEAQPSSAGLTVERVLLDIHSGRWLGSAGVWLMDAAAIALLVLAATGTWTVLKRPRRRTIASSKDSR